MFRMQKIIIIIFCVFKVLQCRIPGSRLFISSVGNFINRDAGSVAYIEPVKIA